MRWLSREEDGVPAGGPEGLSVLSWNLLAPSYEPCGGEDWSTRRPVMQRWLQHHADCDVLCFQEVDRGHSLADIQETLGAHGYEAVVQDRKEFPVVNAIFFKQSRLKLSWADHRSRVLLVGLSMADGRQIGVANVHLQAGDGEANESQRCSQLASALKRLAGRKPSYAVVCGDFNSPVQPSSPLRSLLAEEGLSPVSSQGPTFIRLDRIATFDHLFACKSLQALAALASNGAALETMLARGLPDPEHPSDHLPVAAVFSLCKPGPARARSTRPPTPPVVAPPTVNEEVRAEWLALLRLAGTGGFGKRAVREQRQLEAAFLAAVAADEAAALQQWRAEAARAARAVVAAAAEAATAGLRGKVLDPGGGALEVLAWARG